MKKNALYFGIAALALLVISCSKGNEISAPDTEKRVTMIDPWTAIDQSPYAIMQKGNGVSISADLFQTKSSMVMDGSGNFAKVQWSAGDSFEMYGWNESAEPEPSFASAIYSTTETKEKAVFTSLHVLPPAPQHCIFAPSSATIKLGHDSSGDFFGVKIPANQIAVAGKVKDEYLYSYAQTNFTGSHVDLDATHHATFRSMLAFVRFKMTGDIASSVTSITLTGASALAGDCTMVPGADGTPVLTFSKKFTGDVASTTVTLTGTFTAGTDYYIAVVPGTQSSFTLVFSDGGGNSTTKIATKSVTFARGVINDIGVIDLGNAFTDPATPSMETIKWNTASAGAAKPVTIAVIPDGFTAAEMPKYEMLANAAMNTLFNVEPFKSYKNYFNVYILKVASNESGANVTDGLGHVTEAHDCYFGSGWGASSYDDLKAGYGKGEGGTNKFHDIVFEYVTANCPDITSIGGSTVYHTIDEVPVLMIINDTRYGGINITYSSGRSYCLAPYTYSGGGLSWSYPSQEAVSDMNPSAYYATKSSETYYTDIKAAYQNTTSERYTEVGSNSGNWLNTMVHEFGGHCFSRLADEYWYGPQYYLTHYVMTESQAIDESIKDAVTHIDGYQYSVPFRNNVSATYYNPGYDTGTYAANGWQFLLDKKAELAASNPLYNRIGVYQGGNVSMMNRWRSERVSCMIDNRFYFSTFQRYLIVKRIMSLAGKTFDSEAAFLAAFWAKDVPIDPVRDIAVSPVMGESNAVPPRPVPMLPPPVLVEVNQ